LNNRPIQVFSADIIQPGDLNEFSGNDTLNQTIDRLAKGCIIDVLTIIKTNLTAIANSGGVLSDLRGQMVSDPRKFDPIKKEQARKSRSRKTKDGSFSAKTEEDMNIMTGVSINSKPRADGRFQGYIIEDGKRSYVYGRTQDEVALKIKKYIKNGIPKKKKKSDSPTVREWAERWLELYKIPNLKPKSIESIRYSLRKIYPRFGDTPLGELKTMDLQEFFLSITQTRARDLALTVMTEMLEKARKQGVIAANPCEGVEIKKHVTQKKDALTPEQTETLLAAVKGTTIEGIFTLLLTGGFRIGELLALTSDDVDFKNNTVSINKDVVFVKGKRIVQTTKTQAGVRTIPLPQSSIDLLKGRKGQLFDMTYNAVRNGFRRLSEKTGIDVSAHKLRHTYATRLEEAGVPPKVKQYLLGHSDVDMTQNVYTDTQMHYVNRFIPQITGAFDTET